MSLAVANLKLAYAELSAALPHAHVAQHEPSGIRALLTLGLWRHKVVHYRFRSLMWQDGVTLGMPFAPGSVMLAEFREVHAMHRSAVRLSWVPPDGHPTAMDLSLTRALRDVVRTVVDHEVGARRRYRAVTG